MAKKIPVRVHIGVTTMPLMLGVILSEMRVTMTEEGSGTLHLASILPDAVPTPDEGGGASFVVNFPAVQSGESLHVDVRCLDDNGARIGAVATHTALLDEVPDDPPLGTFFQPVSIYFNPI